jgi:hypothetical protein
MPEHQAGREDWPDRPIPFEIGELEGDDHQRPEARHADHPKKFVFPIDGETERGKRRDSFVEAVGAGWRRVDRVTRDGRLPSV